MEWRDSGGPAERMSSRMPVEREVPVIQDQGAGVVVGVLSGLLGQVDRAWDDLSDRNKGARDSLTG